jgi:hypothetical protein
MLGLIAFGSLHLRVAVFPAAPYFGIHRPISAMAKV